jgi:hypothetical protein
MRSSPAVLANADVWAATTAAVAAMLLTAAGEGAAIGTAEPQWARGPAAQEQELRSKERGAEEVLGDEEEAATAPEVCKEVEGAAEAVAAVAAIGAATGAAGTDRGSEAEAAAEAEEEEVVEAGVAAEAAAAAAVVAVAVATVAVEVELLEEAIEGGICGTGHRGPSHNVVNSSEM